MLRKLSWGPPRLCKCLQGVVLLAGGGVLPRRVPFCTDGVVREARPRPTCLPRLNPTVAHAMLTLLLQCASCRGTTDEMHLRHRRSPGKKAKDEGNTIVGLNSTADDEPDATYLIRYTYDTGDVYMRSVSKAAMEESVADALDPASGLGSLAGPRQPSAKPAPPSKGRDIMAGWNVSDGPDLPSMGRRLLQQQDIVGEDNRTQISTAPVYPYSAVAYIRWVGGGQGRVGFLGQENLTEALCSSCEQPVKVQACHGPKRQPWMCQA